MRSPLGPGAGRHSEVIPVTLRGPWGAGPGSRLTFKAEGPRLWAGTSYRASNEAWAGLGTGMTALGRKGTRERKGHPEYSTTLRSPLPPAVLGGSADGYSPGTPAPVFMPLTVAQELRHHLWEQRGLRAGRRQLSNAQCFVEHVV